MKELPEIMTHGEVAEPAMKIETQEEADEYLELLIQRAIKYFKQTREDAEKIIRENLGYSAGYHNHETRLRVERLFKCVHPVLGDASKGEPTPEECFQKGMEYAKKRQDMSSLQ